VRFDLGHGAGELFALRGGEGETRSRQPGQRRNWRVVKGVIVAGST
jgi:hypothetical protein